MEIQNVPRGTFEHNLFLGLGMGNFVFLASNFIENSELVWKCQPIHNVFYMVLMELGLFGLLLFVFWIYKLFHVEQWRDDLIGFRDCFLNKKIEEDILYNNILFMSIRLIIICLQGLLSGFIFIMFFDHYFWDIWQGQVMFWLAMSLLAGLNSFWLIERDKESLI
jgi:hypothetical protein